MSHYGSWLHSSTDKFSGFERQLVEVGNTSFNEGREFRIFKELNIAASSTYVMRLGVPIDVVLFGLAVEIEAGWLRLAAVAGGSEGGSYSEVVPIFAANGMTGGVNRRLYSGSVYATQCSVTAGGTHSGGTEVEVIRIKTSNNTQQAFTVGGHGQDERGIAPNTYYLVLQNLSGTDAITGVLRLRWEERP